MLLTRTAINLPLNGSINFKAFSHFVSSSVKECVPSSIGPCGYSIGALSFPISFPLKGLCWRNIMAPCLSSSFMDGPDYSPPFITQISLLHSSPFFLLRFFPQLTKRIYFNGGSSGHGYEFQAKAELHWSPPSPDAEALGVPSGKGSRANSNGRAGAVGPTLLVPPLII